MNNNLVRKSIVGCIDAIKKPIDVQKQPNWLFRFLIVCIFIVFYFYFLMCLKKLFRLCIQK